MIPGIMHSRLVSLVCVALPVSGSLCVRLCRSLAVSLAPSLSIHSMYLSLSPCLLSLFLSAEIAAVVGGPKTKAAAAGVYYCSSLSLFLSLSLARSLSLCK